jgi:hypothetical protein
MTTATRTSQEVFQHHAQALGAADLEQILADYEIRLKPPSRQPGACLTPGR